MTGKSKSTLLTKVYWPCLIIAGLGAGAQLKTMLTGRVVDVLILSAVRNDLFTGEIVLPLPARIAANFSYSAIAMGTVLAHRDPKRSLGVLSVVWPLLLLFGTSISSGGRGPLLIGFSIMLWTAACYSGSQSILVVQRKKMIGLAFLLLAYIVAIDNLRPDSSGGLGGVQISFIGALPALSVWLDTARALPIFHLDLTEVAPVRELLNVLGHPHVRSVDTEVVYIPFAYNVYTILAEHLVSFGLAGALFASSALGFLTASIETYMKSEVWPAMAGLFYTYLSWSLISDLSFLASGWLLAVTLVGLIGMRLRWSR